MPNSSIPEIRNHLRATRNQLTQTQQQANAQLATQNLIQWIDNRLTKPSNIAVFLSQDGELDTTELIAFFWSQTSHSLFLPVLQNKHGLPMGFYQYQPQTQLCRNRFGIEEPNSEIATEIMAEQLDLVIMPLVGFDKHGNRLGMGGGYYDRTFEFKLNKPDSNPILLGWAHQCQQYPKLPNQPWDIPLNAVCSEQGVMEWKL